MSDDAANAEAKQESSADALRPQRLETAAVFGKAQSPKSQPRAADGGPSEVRRRWKRILIACCAAMVLLFALLRLLDRQPRYRGRTVESWLAQVMTDEKNKQEALNALTAMGREAVPYEIKALRRGELFWRRKLRWMQAKSPAFAKRWFPDLPYPNYLRDGALVALGNNPHSPEFAHQLVPLLDDPNPNVSRPAALLVCKFAQGHDRSAILAACRLLKGGNRYDRVFAASTLGRMGTIAEDAVPDLKLALEDADFEVRRAAANSILRIHGTNLADGPLKQRVDEIQLEAAQRGPTNVTNR